MFQYGTKHDVLEDTGLITINQAYELRDKWLDHMKDHWDEWDSPQMCIWSDCATNTDYRTVEFDIDFRDCELKDGHFYKVEKKRLI